MAIPVEMGVREMELRELAERVLFAKTLEEKLQCPEAISDERPGAAIAAPAMPGRPEDLVFKGQGGGGKSEFPGTLRLEDERERGKLLHFFANHELLATELMALVLLRFPDAPAAFRRGVLNTLRDEQEHTRLYLERMKACGIQFGELPVSGYFWRSVSGMENPMDYVAGLSLTFEQANLDFCLHFAREFQAAGDPATAQLLERIYRDEIAHVAYGLKWFRRWKNPTESDWDAFCRQLKFPLSPRRARGISLNIEGRRAAGLDEGFITELNIFHQSKGRTPDVYVFNPLAEGRIAEGRKFNPVKHQAALARDLANLPQFLCRQDDIVLVEKRPAAGFLAGIQAAGFALPEFAELKRGGIDPQSALAQRKLHRLRPWAWGPDSLELFEPVLANVGGEQRTPQQRFNAGIAELYSKAWSAQFLKSFLGRWSAGQSSWLCSPDETGLPAGTLEEALALVAEIRKCGHHKVVIKEAHGLAGHNAMRLWEPEVLDNQRRWIANAVAGGRPVVVEPWLERVADFSVQIEMGERGAKIGGYTGLINDRRGQFIANWAAPNYERRLPARAASLFAGMAEASAQLPRLFTDLVAALAEELRRLEFRGALGIDAFIYRAATGDLRVKPVVEINPRYTMGRVLVELMKRTCPGSWGSFRIVRLASVRQQGLAGFAEYARQLESRFPLRLQGEPVERISEGAVCLNDPSVAESCLALFHVTRSWESLELSSVAV